VRPKPESESGYSYVPENLKIYKTDTSIVPLSYTQEGENYTYQFTMPGENAVITADGNPFIPVDASLKSLLIEEGDILGLFVPDLELDPDSNKLRYSWPYDGSGDVTIDAEALVGEDAIIKLYADTATGPPLASSSTGALSKTIEAEDMAPISTLLIAVEVPNIPVKWYIITIDSTSSVPDPGA
jgi:hypothetical protein